MQIKRIQLNKYAFSLDIERKKHIINMKTIEERKAIWATVYSLTAAKAPLV